MRDRDAAEREAALRRSRSWLAQHRLRRTPAHTTHRAPSPLVPLLSGRVFFGPPASRGRVRDARHWPDEAPTGTRPGLTDADIAAADAWYRTEHRRQDAQFRAGCSMR